MSFSKSELTSCNWKFQRLKPIIVRATWRQELQSTLNKQSAKCPAEPQAPGVCLFHQLRFQQEEHAHFGLRLLNSAQLITCTACDEELPILMGNESWYFFYVVLQGAVSPSTCISFSDCRSSAPLTLLSHYLNLLSRLFWLFVFFSLPLFSSSFLHQTDFFLSSPPVLVFYFVVVIVNKRKCLGQLGNDAVRFKWPFIKILLKKIKLIHSL